MPPKRKPKAPPSEITDKLKFLCLHGYRQNAESFKSKIGSFRKHVSKYADFVFISAPHVAPAPTVGGNQNQDQRSWWFNKDDGTFSGVHKSAHVIGFDESVKLVEEVWREQGPFQGLLGFSQGACFVGLLCSLGARGLTNVRPDFAIMAAGFRSGSLAHLAYYEDPIGLTSMHIIGQSDEIIPHQNSEELAQAFVDPAIVRHLGGHYFAATSTQKPEYIEFFRDMLLEHLEAKELSMATANNSMDVDGEVDSLDSDDLLREHDEQDDNDDDDSD